MFELFVVNGICGGTVFFLPDVPTVLGRSLECHVQVTDPWISSMHALFERRGEELWVVDLDSRNGTFLDGERVHAAPVRPGAKLRFGRTGAELRDATEVGEPPSILSDQRTVIRYIADLAPEPAARAAGAVGGASGGTEASPLPPRSRGPGRVAEPDRETARGPVGVTGSARRHIGVLNEIGRALLGAVGLAEALERLLRVLGGALGAERSSVLLMDERGGLVPVLALPADRPPRLSDTVVQATLRSRAGILTLDAQQDLRFSQSKSVIAHGIHSCICAPIWADNRVLGVVLLERGVVDPFTADDLELATLVGFQAALAVERARIAERAEATEQVRQGLARHLDPAATAALLAPENADGDLLAPAFREGVAVVAARVAGLETLAATLSASAAAARALALQRALSDAALSEGAVVERSFDGGLLAVFGLLQPVPDAESRAARCAAALVARGRQAEAAAPGPRLEVYAGVAVGRALVGNFGSADHPELRAVGEVVEAARRRARAAPAGGVLDRDP